MSRYPDLVKGTKLDTTFADGYTVHEHDDSEDERRLSRPVRRVEYWATEKPLAEGGFGEVYLERCVEGRRRGEWRAVKVVSKHKSKAKKINYVTEIETIAKFSQKRYSKCFVKLLGWYDSDDRIYIAMEYFPLGDLQQYMSDNLHFPESDAQHVTYQILEGLDYMHSEDFAHRDIKPGNVLIKSRPPDGSWWIKLSDFGISKRFDPSVEQVSSIKGTMGYMAPELFDYEPGSSLVINHRAADMWSVGEMVFRMLSKTAAFRSLHALLRYLARPDLFPSKLLEENGVSEQAVGFIQSLMRPTPETRLTSNEALNSSWLRFLRPSAPAIVPIASRSTTPIPPVESTPAMDMGQWATESSTHMSMSHPSLSATVRPMAGPLPTSAQAVVSHNSVSSFLPTVRPSPLTNESNESSNDEVWDRKSGVHTQTFEVHGWWGATSVAFSPDGRQIVSGSRTIEVWDCDSGVCTQTLEGHGDHITSVEFSPDSRQIVSASDDKTIKVWDRDSGTCTRTLEGHSLVVNEAIFSPDGRRIISCSRDGTIRVWNRDSGICMRTLEAHSGGVHVVAISPDGRRIASGDKSLYIWDHALGVRMQTLGRHSPYTVAFSPDGRHIISGLYDGTIEVWDYNLAVRKKTLKGGGYAVYSVRFSSDGRYIVSGSGDGIVRVWDHDSGVRTHMLDHGKKVYSVAISPDSRQIISGSDDGTIKVWDIT